MKNVTTNVIYSVAIGTKWSQQTQLSKAMKAHWEGNPQVHETFDPESVTGVDKTMFPSATKTIGWDDMKRNDSSALIGGTCRIALLPKQRQSQRNARNQSADFVVLPLTTAATVTS